MSQEPWNEEVYQTDTVSRKDRFEKTLRALRYLQYLQLSFS